MYELEPDAHASAIPVGPERIQWHWKVVAVAIIADALGNGLKMPMRIALRLISTFTLKCNSIFSPKLIHYNKGRKLFSPCYFFYMKNLSRKMSFKGHYRIALLCITIFHLASSSTWPIIEVHNTRQEIDNCMKKLNLTLLRTWGGDEKEDINQFFKDPMDIAIGKDALVYICDSGFHRIQVFDGTQKYVRTLGRQGSGPADILNPCAIDFDSRGNLVIGDQWNFRIQFLNTSGKSIGAFRLPGTLIRRMSAANKKDEIIIYRHSKTFITRKILYVFDYKGNPIREIGDYKDNSKKVEEAESVFFDLDKDDNIYTSYSITPYLLKYSYPGEILMFMTFELPFESQSAFFEKKSKSVVIKGEKKNIASMALSLDETGRIFLVSPKRLGSKKEFFQSSGVVKPGGGNYRLLQPVENQNTDCYILLVFNTSGKIIAGCQLNVFCNNIYIHGDRLFIIDSYNAMKIYEYKMKFK